MIKPAPRRGEGEKAAEKPVEPAQQPIRSIPGLSSLVCFWVNVNEGEAEKPVGFCESSKQAEMENLEGLGTRPGA